MACVLEYIYISGVLYDSILTFTLRMCRYGAKSAAGSVRE
ncbi:hypothetical protein ASZ90_010241 [hydrocarbon metagenome]|uniref:Uncharacterized protein n=1 Tax=hydrocarbon metagenome TaxID=938273 RepID=A0A0W8FGN3_9ZZZZ